MKEQSVKKRACVWESDIHELDFTSTAYFSSII